MSIQPTDKPRRSFLYRKLQAASARFEAIGDAAIAAAFGDDDLAQAGKLGLADLSPLPRTGFKGKGTPEWLQGQGVSIPDAPNGATRQADGAVVVRLSNEEHLILSDLSATSTLPTRLDDAWSMDVTGVYHLPRRDSHAWFLVTGAHARAMFAKLCAIDLREAKFADLQVAQTSVARLSAIIVRDDSVPAFHILSDSASAEYLWECLIDAYQEFGGAPVGYDAVTTLFRGATT